MLENTTTVRRVRHGLGAAALAALLATGLAQPAGAEEPQPAPTRITQDTSLTVEPQQRRQAPRGVADRDPAGKPNCKPQAGGKKCKPKPPCQAGDKECKPKPCKGRECPRLPVCNAGGGRNVAYTAYPRDVLRCPNLPSLGFEATSTSEFGDQVGLAATGSTDLAQLRVVFASWGCGTSGHWYSDDCVTAPGATFSHPVTANIYAPNATDPNLPGDLLATVTQNFDIRYRPSADPTRCAGPEAGMWFNPELGQCEDKIRQLLTFDFPGTQHLPSEVIWTVAFNTTHHGYAPIGEAAACFAADPGCGYDWLSVGARTFPRAPYAGTDVDPDGAFINTEVASFYCDGGAAGVDILRLDTGPNCWTAFRPLGEIRTS
ncbi:hypothetical protein [Catellatospora sp. NPDC049609]|uniref:hypothetical protein n=1 Tax=Catellatospora sp. NPDC049609 TaxID=3155505 RepID=UPI0034165CA4